MVSCSRSFATPRRRCLAVRSTKPRQYGRAPSQQANDLLIYGDFASNFVVTQRVGTSVELIPHLFSPNNLRPTGQRGLYAWARWGSDSINDAAFRMLVA